jgi:hypothetical protein
MIVTELQRSEQQTEQPTAVGAFAAEPTDGLSAALLRGIGAIVRYRSAARFAALYPAAMRTVAVNDGSHITTAPHVSLHQALQSMLGARHAWLVFDTESNEVRVLDVPAAQQILYGQSEQAHAPR